MAPVSYLLLALLATADSVLAGSQFWQPALERRNQTLDKRYFSLNKNSAASPYNKAAIWPNKQIRYCYHDDNTKQTLRQNLKAAHERWVSKGLGKDFTFVEVSDTECQEEEFSTLRVLLSDSVMATSAGVPIPNFPRAPTMHLVTLPNVGMQDVVANFAHELGHAWGLYHEHQNPNFWKGTELSENGDVFGPGNNNWECQNLRDYTSAVIGLTTQIPGMSQNPSKDELCNDWRIATKAQFAGGANYLPYPKAMGNAASEGKGNNDVDWQSIMIYPSGAGGIPSAGEPDGRMPILLRPGGARIPPNIYPSTLDIEGLRRLYGSEPSAKGGLLQKVGGSTSSKFNKLYGSSRGSSSACQ